MVEQKMGECKDGEVVCVETTKSTLEELLAAQPLNPFRLLEFRPLLVNEYNRDNS